MSYLGLHTVKPAKPIKRKDTYIFPKTVASQIITDEEKDTRLPATLTAMETATTAAQTTADKATKAASDAQTSANTANANINNLITDIKAIKYVTALPSNPDANTLYLIKK